MSKLSLRTGNLIGRFVRDRRANAAIEFAFIVPLMLAMFFGTVEFSSGYAAKRKVALAARNLSDLVSQSSTVKDLDLDNFNETSRAIMKPYLTSDYVSRVTALYIDPDTKLGKVRWSKGWGLTPRTGTMAVPTALQIGDTNVIYSEVHYKYVPTVGYVMGKTGVEMEDFTYTRPRLSLCVLYGRVTSC